MKIKSIKDFDYNNKTVILRCDFNVPIKDGVVLDDNRIKASIKTINYLISNNAKVVLLSHLGKVKKEEDMVINDMRIVYNKLKELVDFPIYFSNNLDFNKIKEDVSILKNKEAILLQNTRFYDLDNKKESSCDLDLAKSYASLGDIFVLDAFAVLHRCHASVVGIPKFLPSTFGFLVEEEINNLNYFKDPKRPFAVLMGGAKINDKIALIDSLIKKVDYLLIGGALAFTFLKAENLNIGDSFYDSDGINIAKDLLLKYKDKIILPKDFIGTYKDNDLYVCDSNNIIDNFIGKDIGPKTVSYFNDILSNVGSIFWNGPFGIYEDKKYASGTISIIKNLSKDTFSLLGGGDIVACLNMYGLDKCVSFSSTGGGATLTYLENFSLPGIEEVMKSGEML